MAAFVKCVNVAAAGLGEAPSTADTLFELGMMYASGRSVPVDLVTAHKWFNIAAMKGHAEAARLRREIAAEMADAEIGQAQRAARDWLKAHPEPVAEPHAPAPSVRLRGRRPDRPPPCQGHIRRAYRPRTERWPSG